MVSPELLRLHLEGKSNLVLEISLWLLVPVVVFLVGARLWFWRNKTNPLHKYEVVKLNVQLGNVGSVELRPNNEDIQIAHRIWTELVTRKAALPIDIEHDVIVDIYDSWYALFGRIRQLISDIPGHMLREEKSTQELVRIATQTLNNGLRPHLTRWQRRFRHWYAECPDHVKKKCPQDCQRDFPEYNLLIEDIKTVNQQLIQYAGELAKIVHGQTRSS
jgi:hypothetical protein